MTTLRLSRNRTRYRTRYRRWERRLCGCLRCRLDEDLFWARLELLCMFLACVILSLVVTAIVFWY